MLFVALWLVKKLMDQELGLEALNIFVSVRLACMETCVQNLFAKSKVDIDREGP